MLKSEIIGELENWYAENKRPLPWRSNPEPYRVWLAEIVFQQTRIQQGMGHYLRILERFPNVEALAQAHEDEVLKLWEGLGYYSRGRNLLKAAKIISTLGEFPTSATEWQKLPGVGPYTSAAISSVVNNEKIALVDGNVSRVLARVFLIDDDIRSSKTQKELQHLAQKIIDQTDQPGNINQALMELGALICSPKKPKCPVCPINNHCELLLHKEDPNKFPYKSPPPPKTQRDFHWLWASESNYLLLKKRNESDIWQGLFELPSLQNPKKKYPAAKIIHKGTHILSHQRIQYYIWDIKKWESIPQEFKAFALNEELPALPRPLQKFFEN
ncbi:MAG: A/G-specific adenine glycosylase [Flavobacteriales bacterium]|nr:MAG: A/G-specific adenine glycosylase [Flavobacteriales bacterium]